MRQNWYLVRYTLPPLAHGLVGYHEYFLVGGDEPNFNKKHELDF